MSQQRRIGATLVHVVVFITTVCSYCPNGWIRYNNSCYLFEDIAENWNTSKAYCEGFNADLAVPDTPQENNFIKSHLKKIYHDCSNKHDAYYWFGLNDVGQAGEWVWTSNGEPVPYTDWAPNEPRGKGVNCGAYYGSTGFKWDDFGCSAKRKFICEYQDPVEIPSIIG